MHYKGIECRDVHKMGCEWNGLTVTAVLTTGGGGDMDDPPWEEFGEWKMWDGDIEVPRAAVTLLVETYYDELVEALE